MLNSVLLSSYMFGSLYLLTTSHLLLNESLTKNNLPLNLLNGSMFIISGSAYFYGIYTYLSLKN